ncbi:MAG: DsrE family protein [Campylobacterales bacterium]|nr:DsrE family protein [Campylobacterales bacterium]
MAKENLLIIISTDSVDSILKFPLLYGGVALPREYWQRVHIMFWGASIKVAQRNSEVRQKVQAMHKVGVEFSSCIVCANEYGATQELEAIGIVCNHTGELLTTALKNDNEWAVLSI